MERERSGEFTWLRRRRATDLMPEPPPQGGARRASRTLLAAGIFAALTLDRFLRRALHTGRRCPLGGGSGPRAPVRPMARLRLLGTPARQLRALEPVHLLRHAVLRRLSVRPAVPAELRIPYPAARESDQLRHRAPRLSRRVLHVSVGEPAAAAFPRLPALRRAVDVLRRALPAHHGGPSMPADRHGLDPDRLPGHRRSLRGPKPAMGAAGDLRHQHDDTRRRPAVRFLHRRRRGDLLRAVHGPRRAEVARLRSGLPSWSPARRRSRPCSLDRAGGDRRPACADRAACRTSSPACSRSRRGIS